MRLWARVVVGLGCVLCLRVVCPLNDDLQMTAPLVACRGQHRSAFNPWQAWAGRESWGESGAAEAQGLDRDEAPRCLSATARVRGALCPATKPRAARQRRHLEPQKSRLAHAPKHQKHGGNGQWKPPSTRNTTPRSMEAPGTYVPPAMQARPSQARSQAHRAGHSPASARLPPCQCAGSARRKPACQHRDECTAGPRPQRVPPQWW